MEHTINKEIAVKVAIKQNSIRQQMALAKLQKSESAKDYNDKIKTLQQELERADEEWRIGAVQAEFQFQEKDNA